MRNCEVSSRTDYETRVFLGTGISFELQSSQMNLPTQHRLFTVFVEVVTFRHRRASIRGGARHSAGVFLLHASMICFVYLRSWPKLIFDPFQYIFLVLFIPILVGSFPRYFRDVVLLPQMVPL